MVLSLNQKLADRKENYQKILVKLLQSEYEFGELTKREIELLTYALEDVIEQIDKVLKIKANK